MDDQNDEFPLLHDEEHYIRSRGIEQQYVNELDTLNRREEMARLDEAKSYQQQVINKFVLEDAQKSKEKDLSAEMNRVRVLESLKDHTLIIKTVDSVVENIPLSLLLSCDTVYTLASSEHWSSSSHTTKKSLEFSLEQFETSHVKKFLALCKDPQNLRDLQADSIVECCRIAHFLQCKTLLDDIVEIIRESIDAENCYSICILADQLDIHSLFTSSLSYVMERLGTLQKHEAWNEFSPTLQNYIITLRNATQSSIVPKGTKKCKVPFNSSHEFLALFSDHIYDQRERLREAMERQNAIIEERKRRNLTRWRKEDVMGGSVRDAATKIQKQETRLRTLEAFYKEQKAIFASDASGVYQRSFTL